MNDSAQKKLFSAIARYFGLEISAFAVLMLFPEQVYWGAAATFSWACNDCKFASSFGAQIFFLFVLFFLSVRRNLILKKDGLASQSVNPGMVAANLLIALTVLAIAIKRMANPTNISETNRFDIAVEFLFLLVIANSFSKLIIFFLKEKK